MYRLVEALYDQVKGVWEEQFEKRYGSRSKAGTEAAALFYTLFESAKLSGVDPHTYVLEAAKRAIRTPGAVTLPFDPT